jgi:HNH endonuclease
MEPVAKNREKTMKHKTYESEINRFLEMYLKPLAPDECWPWQGMLNADGYGFFQFRIDGIRYTLKAHKAVWEKFKGPIPSGLILMHLCNNPACCNYNPSHIKPGTHKENNNYIDVCGRRPAFYSTGARSSTITGLSFNSYRQRWRAIDNKNNQLYWGLDFFEACCARKSWEAHL